MRNWISDSESGLPLVRSIFSILSTREFTRRSHAVVPNQLRGVFVDDLVELLIVRRERVLVHLFSHLRRAVTEALHGVFYRDVESGEDRRIVRKNTCPQEFINRSKILYIDKKEPLDAEVSTGLQLPVEPSASSDSSSNIVPQNRKNDNPDIQADYRGIDGGALQPTQTAGWARRNPVQTLKRLSKDLGIGQAMGTRKMNNLPNGVAG